MALGKRGVIFTFIAVVFISVLFVLYTFQQPQQRREKAFTLEARVMTMNDIIQDISEDAGRMLDVTTFRAIVAMEDEMANSGVYIDDLNSTFDELFTNGSINGTGQTVMANNTWPVWRDRMIEQASKIDVTLSLGAGAVNITHTTPWDVTSQFDLNVVVSDSVTNTSWDDVKQITSTMSILLFEDPIYRLNTNGLVGNTVVMTNITNFVTGNDTTNLMTHTNNSFYRNWTAAPSFLDRFEGNLNVSSPYGIESLVNIQELADAGIPIKAKSIVDYIYFSSSDPVSCTTDHTPSWWQIDGLSDVGNTTQHPYYYEVEGIINPGCI